MTLIIIIIFFIQIFFAVFLKPLISDVATINSKIDGTPKGVYLPILKLHSILAVAILLAHNNIANHKLLWASKFATAKIECNIEMGK